MATIRNTRAHTGRFRLGLAALLLATVSWLAHAFARNHRRSTVQPADPITLPRISEAPGRATASSVRVASDPILRGRQRHLYWCLVIIWVASNIVFWSWLVQAEHIESLWFFVVFGCAYAYEVTFLPSMYLFYVGRMRRPRPVDPPPGLRVALITLCVPRAETVDVIVKQLEALVRVRYPHESWILDEGNDPAVRAAAERLGVRHFTRKGVVRCNQTGPPFMARTKAGNVNAWLDAHGHEYDFFVQLDVDHRPEPNYLDRVLGYFRDPSVAWIQAPSLYGNLDNWVARGAAEQELVLQGPLQRGFYGASATPFIIGSHCAYRMSAIVEIGGFQPTRAEDHLDTIILASRGYQGVFVDEVLAVGEGPDTFDTYLRQQFAWAYSMIQIMLHFTPRLVWRYRPIQAIQFLFAETWYTCWSTSMLILFATPVVVLLTGEQPSDVPLRTFAVALAPVGLTCFAVWWWTRPWHLPSGLGLSWRGVVLHIARWPIVCWALLNVVLRVKHPYMVTPKGEHANVPPFSLRDQAIYLCMAWINVASIWVSLVRDGRDSPHGYMLFAILGILLMTTVVATNVAMDFAEVRRRGLGWLRIARLRAGPLSTILATVSVSALTIMLSGERAVQAAIWVGDTPRVATAAEKGRDVLRAAAETGARTPSGDGDDSVSANPVIDVQSAPSRETDGSGPLSSSTAATEDAWARVEAARAARTTSPSLDLPSDRLSVGAYDPGLAYDHLAIDIEHWYVRQDEPELLAGALARARGRRTLLVTIEPFPPRGAKGPVLDAIVAGQADDELRELAQVVRSSWPQTALVRWGHEMEVSGLYPWAANRPDLYRSAFRRVVTIFRETGATNARWVWSPVGNPGLDAYHPGDDVVDYVGLTVLGDASWDAGFGLPPQSFAQLLEPRYNRVVEFGKPVIVAEFGVSGSAERKLGWMSAASQSMDEFPLVRALVYFNDVNAPTTLSSQPDWRLAPELLSQFLNRVEMRAST